MPRGAWLGSPPGTEMEEGGAGPLFDTFSDPFASSPGDGFGLKYISEVMAW